MFEKLKVWLAKEEEIVIRKKVMIPRLLFGFFIVIGYTTIWLTLVEMGLFQLVVDIITYPFTEWFGMNQEFFETYIIGSIIEWPFLLGILFYTLLGIMITLLPIMVAGYWGVSGEKILDKEWINDPEKTARWRKKYLDGDDELIELIVS